MPHHVSTVYPKRKPHSEQLSTYMGYTLYSSMKKLCSVTFEEVVSVEKSQMNHGRSLGGESEERRKDVKSP